MEDELASLASRNGIPSRPSMLFRSGLGFTETGRSDTIWAASPVPVDVLGTLLRSCSCNCVAIRFAPSSRISPLPGPASFAGLASVDDTGTALLEVAANVVGFVLALVLLCPVTKDLNVLLVGANEPFEFLLDPVKDDEASIVDGV